MVLDIELVELAYLSLGDPQPRRLGPGSISGRIAPCDGASLGGSLRPRVTIPIAACSWLAQKNPLLRGVRRSVWEISVNQDENVTLVLW